MKKLSAKFIKIVLPLLLGGVILYWMYRDFDFHSISDVLFHKMNWMWMLLSFPFGISAQAFRGWRWRQTLEPIGEKPRTSTLFYFPVICRQSYRASNGRIRPLWRAEAL